MALTAQDIPADLIAKLVPQDWDLLRSGQAAGFNLPTPRGAEMGAHLARLTTELPEVTGSPMCDECAYRKGTIPNQCSDTVAVAAACALTGEVFDCHKQFAADGTPVRECGGWARWKQRNG